MANMTYCRFQNTLKDLQDCFDALNDEPIDELSGDELASAKDMLLLCEEFIQEHSEKMEDHENYNNAFNN